MATYSKLFLSGSSAGKQILIAATTSASATQIHTAVAGSSSMDEVWLYAYNDSTGSSVLSLLWGGTVEPNDVVRISMLPRAGRNLIADGKLLANSNVISAYSDVANVIAIDGFINRIV